MRAEVQKQRAKVVEAEALIPQGIAEALRNGTMGVMDYYRLENMKSDTEMRESISGHGNNSQNEEEWYEC